MLFKSSFLRYLIFIVAFWGCSEVTDQQSNTTDNIENEVYKLQRRNLPTEIIEGYIAYMPKAYMAHDSVNLNYELTIVNNYQRPFLLDSIEVFDVENEDTPIAFFDSVYLTDEFERRGIQGADSVRMLGANRFGVAHLWLKMDVDTEPPKQIFHRLHFQLEVADGTSRHFPMDVALIDFPELTGLTLPIPFKKGMWFYGASSHKGSRIITEGKASYAQRFAIDWVYVEDNGTMRKGELGKNESYPTYGIEVMSVADGVVVDVKDSILENTPNSEEMPVRLTRETGSGNSLTIDIGNNIHSHYAHFIPNSLRVKVGDKVTKGQVIGLLGNSGSSSGPHLHFHLETASRYPLGGEGIPYHLESFDQYISFEDEEWPKWDSLFLGEKIPVPEAPFATRNNELPIANGFVKFN